MPDKVADYMKKKGLIYTMDAAGCVYDEAGEIVVSGFFNRFRLAPNRFTSLKSFDQDKFTKGVIKDPNKLTLKQKTDNVFSNWGEWNKGIVKFSSEVPFNRITDIYLNNPKAGNWFTKTLKNVGGVIDVGANTSVFTLGGGTVAVTSEGLRNVSNLMLKSNIWMGMLPLKTLYGGNIPDIVVRDFFHYWLQYQMLDLYLNPGTEIKSIDKKEEKNEETKKEDVKKEEVKKDDTQKGNMPDSNKTVINEITPPPPTPIADNIWKTTTNAIFKEAVTYAIGVINDNPNQKKKWTEQNYIQYCIDNKTAENEPGRLYRAYVKDFQQQKTEETTTKKTLKH